MIPSPFVAATPARPCTARPRTRCCSSTTISELWSVAVMLAALVLSSLLYAPALQAQGRTPVPVAAPPKPLPSGGKHKPASTGTGFLRVLVVFARYAGDTLRTESWPDPDRLPAWAKTMVDATPSAIGRNPENISEYFRRNSNGLFRLVGDVRYVTLDSTEEYYRMRLEGRDEELRGAVIRDALRKLDDPRGEHRVDFRKYDLWSTTDDYAARRKPDGFADMIWFLTRTHSENPFPEGDPRRARYRDYSRVSADFNVNGPQLRFDGVAVNHTAGFVEGRGSGVMSFGASARKPVTLNDTVAGAKGQPRIFGELIHEMGHYLFGPSHLGNSDISLSTTRYTSYFTAYAVTTGNTFGNMLAYERMRLGWVNTGAGTLREVGLSDTDRVLLLEDPHTMGRGTQAARIALQGSPQFLVLENRGWKGPFEARRVPYHATGARLAPGLLVTHIIAEDASLPYTRARIVCADGRYRWRLVRDLGGSNAYTAIEKDSADAFGGYDERERIYIAAHPNRHWLAGYWPTPGGQPRAIGPYLGCSNCADSTESATDNVGDALDVFQPGDVLTPWSNPPLAVWARTRFALPDGAPLGIHVLDRDTRSGALRVRVKRGSLDEFPPSKPTLLRVTDTTRGIISWALNREPAMDDAVAPGRYEIECAAGDGPFTATGSVAHPGSSFTVVAARTGVTRCRVRAVYAHGRFSTWSEECRITAR